MLIVVAIVNLPSLWTGAFVDPALERDESPPAAWTDAAADLDAIGDTGRVLQLPGAEFGAFRWGYTVDQPLPGLTDKPLITRDLLPLGSAGAMDLLYALDDRIQDGVFEPASLAPVSRWLGVDTVWVANDLAFDRFRTARPQPLTEQIAGGARRRPGAARRHAGGRTSRRCRWSTSRRSPIPTATARELAGRPLPGRHHRGRSCAPTDHSVVVSGSGDGLVDLAAAGLLDGDELVRYSASLERRPAASRRWPTRPTCSSPTRIATGRATGAARRTRPGTPSPTSPAPGCCATWRPTHGCRSSPSATSTVDPATQTVARQVGPVTATATSYGEPFAYLPEHRPYMAIDGDPATAWTVGEHADPIGETLRLHFDQPPAVDRSRAGVGSRAAAGSPRSTVGAVGAAEPQRVELTDESMTSPGQQVALPAGATDVDITIARRRRRQPFTGVSRRRRRIRRDRHRPGSDGRGRARAERRARRARRRTRR